MHLSFVSPLAAYYHLIFTEESAKVEFFQKWIFLVTFELFVVPFLIFSTATEVTEHHTTKITDCDSFSWSFPDVPE